jgi:hypothetical protein
MDSTAGSPDAPDTLVVAVSEVPVVESSKKAAPPAPKKMLATTMTSHMKHLDPAKVEEALRSTSALYKTSERPYHLFLNRMAFDFAVLDPPGWAKLPWLTRFEACQEAMFKDPHFAFVHGRSRSSKNPPAPAPGGDDADAAAVAVVKPKRKYVTQNIVQVEIDDTVIQIESADAKFKLAVRASSSLSLTCCFPPPPAFFHSPRPLTEIHLPFCTPLPSRRGRPLSASTTTTTSQRIGRTRTLTLLPPPSAS